MLKYADIWYGCQPKSSFARMGHISSSEQMSFFGGFKASAMVISRIDAAAAPSENEVFNESETTTQGLY